MEPKQTTLSDENRAKLDDIVKKMLENGELEADVQFVVDDFKKKYAGEPVKKKEPSETTGEPSEQDIEPTEKAYVLELPPIEPAVSESTSIPGVLPHITPEMEVIPESRDEDFDWDEFVSRTAREKVEKTVAENKVKRVEAEKKAKDHKENISSADTYLKFIPKNVFYASKETQDEYKEEMRGKGISERAINESFAKMEARNLEKMGKSYLQDERKLATKELFAKELDPKRGIVDQLNEIIAADRTKFAYSHLTEDQREIADLVKQHKTLLDKGAKTPEEVTEILRLEQQISLLKENPKQLYDPRTGDFIAEAEAGDEANAYERQVNKEADSLLKNHRERLSDIHVKRYAELKEVEKLFDQEVTYMSGDFTRSLSPRMMSAMPWPELAFIGSDAVGQAKRMREIYNKAKGSYDAVNRALLLNEDPAGVEKGFFASLGEALVEATLPIEVETEKDFIRNYVDDVRDEGLPVSEEQAKKYENTLSEDVGAAMGNSIPIMVEIIATTMMTEGLGTIPVLARVGRTLKTALTARWGKAGTWTYNLIKEPIRGAVSFGAAPSEDVTAIMGAGEGFAQGIMANLNPEKWLKGSRFARLFEYGARVAAGGTTETVQEFTGQYLEELDKSGFNYQKAFEETFGRNTEDFLDQLAVIGLTSLMFSGSFNLTVFTRVKSEIEAMPDSDKKKEVLDAFDDGQRSIKDAKEKQQDEAPREQEYVKREVEGKEVLLKKTGEGPMKVVPDTSEEYKQNIDKAVPEAEVEIKEEPRDAKRTEEEVEAEGEAEVSKEPGEAEPVRVRDTEQLGVEAEEKVEPVFSEEIEQKMTKHAEHHTEGHMSEMRKLMDEGASFDEAHTQVQEKAPEAKPGEVFFSKKGYSVVPQEGELVVTNEKTDEILEKETSNYKEAVEEYREQAIPSMQEGKRVEGEIKDKQEYVDRVMEESQNPSEIAQAYLTEVEAGVTEDLSLDEAIASNIGKVTSESFGAVNDPNNITPGIRLKYFSSKEKGARSIDSLAEVVISSNPQFENMDQKEVGEAIAEFIINNPGGPTTYEQAVPVNVEGLEKSFKKLTGLTLDEDYAKRIVAGAPKPTTEAKPVSTEPTAEPAPEVTPEPTAEKPKKPEPAEVIEKVPFEKKKPEAEVAEAVDEEARVKDSISQAEEALTGLKNPEATKIDGRTIGEHIDKLLEDRTIDRKRHQKLRDQYDQVVKDYQSFKAQKPEDIKSKKLKKLFEERRTDEERASVKHIDAFIKKMKKAFPNFAVTTDVKDIDIALKNMRNEGTLKGKQNPRGFFYEGKVYVDPRGSSLETPIHEFAHPFVFLMKQKFPELYKRGAALIKDTALMEDVKEEYSNLSEEYQVDEAIVRAIAAKGTAEFLKGRKNLASKLVQWVKDFWNKVKSFSGIKPKVDLMGMTLQDFTAITAKEMMRGVPVTQATADVVMTADPEGELISIEGGILDPSITTYDKMRNWMGKQFNERGNMPRDVFERYIKSQKEIRALVKEAEQNVGDLRKSVLKRYGTLHKVVPGFLQKVDRDIMILLDDILKGKKESTALDPEVAVALHKMRTHIDRLSRKFVELGIVDGKLAVAFNDNLGIYVNRSYAVHQDPKWAEKVPEQIKRDARAYIISEYTKGTVFKVDFERTAPNLANVKIITNYGAEVKIDDMTGQEMKRVFGTDAYSSIYFREKTKGSYYPAEDINLKGKIELPEVSESEVEGRIKQLLYDQGDKSPISILSGGKIGKKDLGILKGRKDIPEVIRKLMGEYTDPVTNYFNSISKMANLIENDKFLKDVKKMGMGKIFFKPEDRTSRNFVKVSSEGNKALDPLDGLYTSPEVKEALEDSYSAQSLGDISRFWMKLMGSVKYSKTILSHVTHIRNFTANISFALANGNFDFRKMPDAFRTVATNLRFNNKEEFRKKYLEYVRLGVVDESTNMGEMMDIVKDMSKEVDEPMQFYDNYLKRVVKKPFKVAQDLYMSEDDVWKIFRFESEKAKYKKAYGDTKSEAWYNKKASRIVRDTSPTYSLVPRIVKWLRRFPITGTFVSFPAAVTVNAINTAKLAKAEMQSDNAGVRKIGMLRATTGLITMSVLGTGALSVMSQMMSGIGDEEKDDMQNFMPPWHKNSQKFYMEEVSPGVYRYVDMSFSDSYNYIKRPFVAVLNSTDKDDDAGIAVEAMKELLDPYIGQDILFRHASELISDWTSERGDIVNPQGSWSGQMWDATAHMWDAFEPGTVTSLERVWKGYYGLTEKGRKYDLGTEAAASALGLRISTLDIGNSLLYKGIEFKERTSKDRSIYTKKLYAYEDGASMGQEDVALAYEEANESRKKSYQEMSDVVHAAMRLNVPIDKVMASLKDAGLSDIDIRRLLGGTYQDISIKH